MAHGIEGYTRIDTTYGDLRMFNAAHYAIRAYTGSNFAVPYIEPQAEWIISPHPKHFGSSRIEWLEFENEEQIRTFTGYLGNPKGRILEYNENKERL